MLSVTFFSTLTLVMVYTILNRNIFHLPGMWVIASENIPEMIASGILSVTTSPIVFLIITNIIFLIAGMFESGSANILLFLPIVYPTALKLGIDPIFYGTVIVSNLTIGLLCLSLVTFYKPIALFFPKLFGMY